MTQVTVHEAKTHLSRLIQLALAGEAVIIERGSQPLVKLTVAPEAPQARRIGGTPGVVVAMAADFDAPLDEMRPYMP